ncbi:hypothetical protein [Streptomyces capuensis]|uniref:hypothetical protein n=1 Tax=Streptomyces capuensis TaxID=1464056 RepID=UPI00131A5D05|nr:hypothetical protein [Streptomyces capuensis]
MDDVDDDAHVDVVEAGFGLDKVELVAGAVDQDDPGATVVGVAGLGVVEDLRHDVLCVVLDRTAQPFAAGDGTGPANVPVCEAAGRDDHIVRSAGCGLGAATCVSWKVCSVLS